MIKINELCRRLPDLETTRLTLRKIALDDAADVFVYSADKEVTRFLRWGPHRSPDETQRYIAEVLRHYTEGSDGPWGIEYKPTRKVIGSVHLMAVSAQHHRVEIGFVLSRLYWNRGLMSEALETVLEYGFESIGLNRIEGFCPVDNRAGMRVMEKVGMKQEGILREYLFQKDSYGDFALWSMLHDDYESLRGVAEK